MQSISEPVRTVLSVSLRVEEAGVTIPLLTFLSVYSCELN